MGEIGHPPMFYSRSSLATVEIRLSAWRSYSVSQHPWGSLLLDCMIWDGSSVWLAQQKILEYVTMLCD